MNPGWIVRPEKINREKLRNFLSEFQVRGAPVPCSSRRKNLAPGGTRSVAIVFELLTTLHTLVAVLGRQGPALPLAAAKGKRALPHALDRIGKGWRSD